MAGTDQSKANLALTLGGPAIILVRPQLGENIGTAARAMANFALGDLRLVAPRDGWPNPRARSASSGADYILDNVKVFATTEEAIADLDYVIATTARERELVKVIMTPETAAVKLRTLSAASRKTGIMFGPERTGLLNDDVALTDASMMVPVNPAFASLNLAQAVLLVGYEWFKHADASEPERLELVNGVPATKEEIVGFFEHLESELDRQGFLRPPEKRPVMVRNLRSIFQRAQMTDQEVRSLRGVISALIRRVPRGKGPEKGPEEGG